MKKICFSLSFLLLLFFEKSYSQVFWTEDFTTGTGWTLNVVTGTEGADPNYFLIEDYEGGGITPDLGAPGSCGVASNGNNTLHVTSVFNPTGGAAYDAGGLCGILYCPQADRRSESPTINCTGKSNISLHFHYIENGQGTTDNATCWYYDGSTWSQLDDMPKTLTGCGGQGLWTSRTLTLPVSADNNPNVRFAFRWVNNDDGAGTDPSFAVDDIEISVPGGAAPVANFSASDSTICVGSCINFTDLSTNSPTSWSWTFTGGTPGTSTVQSPTSICYNTAGTYTVTLVATNGSGADTETKTSFITVVASPSVSVLPSSPSYCPGGSVNLTASGATTYTWSPSGGLSSTTGSTVTANPASTTIYTVTGSTSGCTGTTSVTVTVNSLPTVSVTPNPVTICSGNSVTLTASGASTYSWSPNTGLSTTTGSSVIANPTSNITYTVTGTDANGCSNTTSVSVTVTSAIIADAGTDTAICSGSSVSLNASGGTSYAWSPSTGLSCTSCQSPIANPTSTITYTVTVSSGSCTPATDDITITVNTAPAANAGSDVTICNGDNTQLIASGGTSYAWSPATGLSCTNCSNPVAQPTSTTTYIVTVTDVVGCTDTDDVIVNVSAAVVANAGADTSFCAGGNVQLSATGGTTYAWSPSAGLSCTNCPNPVANPATTTTYTVTVSSGSCTPSTDDITVTVNPIPTANAGSDITICNGDNTTLTASGGTSYTWSPATGLSCTNCQSPVASPTATTTYVVIAIGAGNCTDSDDIVVTVNPAIVADAGNDTTICSGDSMVLSASGGTTYSWSPSSGLSCTTCQNPVASPSSTTTYTVTVNNGICSPATDAVTITVTTIPVASVDGDTLICEGGNTTLTASGGASYIWNTGQTTSSITIYPVTTTLYHVTVSNGGQCTDVASININVIPTPNLYASNDTTIAIGTSTQLSADGGVAWTWSPDNDLSCTTCQDPVASPTETTTYYVTITDTSGCTTVDSVIVTVDMNCGDVFVPSAFSPDNDGNNDTLFVYGNCIEFMDFAIYDRWGNLVFSSINVKEGWDGAYNGTLMNSDVYYYYLKVVLYDGTLVDRHGDINLFR